eukprot:104311-Alexandrium_andersonii.AAC.1
MSASLVGSEMCIRDRLRLSGRPERPDTHLLRPRGRPEWVIKCTRSGHREGRNGRKCICLLYTSDAADDM